MTKTVIRDRELNVEDALEDTRKVLPAVRSLLQIENVFSAKQADASGTTRELITEERVIIGPPAYVGDVEVTRNAYAPRTLAAILPSQWRGVPGITGSDPARASTVRNADKRSWRFPMVARCHSVSELGGDSPEESSRGPTPSSAALRKLTDECAIHLDIASQQMFHWSHLACRGHARGAGSSQNSSLRRTSRHNALSSKKSRWSSKITPIRPVVTVYEYCAICSFQRTRKVHAYYFGSSQLSAAL